MNTLKTAQGMTARTRLRSLSHKEWKARKLCSKLSGPPEEGGGVLRGYHGLGLVGNECSGPMWEMGASALVASMRWLHRKFRDWRRVGAGGTPVMWSCAHTLPFHRCRFVAQWPWASLHLRVHICKVGRRYFIVSGLDPSRPSLRTPHSLVFAGLFTRTLPQSLGTQLQSRGFTVAGPGHDCGSCRFLPKPQILLFLLGTLFSPLSLFPELCESEQVLEPQRKVVSEPEIWTFERGPAITHALTFSE